MTLEEVAYMIDGRIYPELSDKYRVMILDSAGGVAKVFDENSEFKNAIAEDYSFKKAKENLVALMRGNYLVHEFSSEHSKFIQSIRIPKTLIAD